MNNIPNSLGQVKIDPKIHTAIIKLIFVLIGEELEKTEDQICVVWEAFIGKAGKYTWSRYSRSVSNPQMLKDELHKNLGGSPALYVDLAEALQEVNPWTPISRCGNFGIVRYGDGFKTLSASKTCPYDKTLLEASNTPTTHWSWTKGSQVPLSEEEDDAYTEPISYDPAVLLNEGLVVHQKFQTAMDHYEVPLIWVLNVVLNAPEALTNFNTPYEAMEFIGRPTMRSQNDIDSLVYLAKQAMDHGQMYTRRPADRSFEPANNRSTTGSVSGTEKLVKLLISLFVDKEDLKRLVKYNYPEISSDLPEGYVSLSEFAFAVVQKLQAHGLLNTRFFDVLAKERPRRAAEIREVSFLIC